MIGFPLLLIPVAICNIIVFLMPDLSLAGPVQLFSLTLPSKDVLQISLKDVLVSLSILLLLLEVMRAAKPASKFFTDHFLSLLVFGGAAYEFVMLPKFGNTTFFLVTLVALVDFLAGISLRARRPRRVAAPVYAPEPVRETAPRYEPAPVPVTPAPAPAPVPAATSVAEAVLKDHPEPMVEKIEPRIETPVPAEVVAHTSPQITSPDLQPGTVHVSPDDKPKL